MVDLSGWWGGDAGSRAAVAADVDLAARSLGFMQLVGHRVPDEATRALVRAIDGFFGLPADVKRRSIAPAGVNRGYTAPGSERLSYSIGLDSPADLFEAFNVGACADDFPHLELDPVVYAANVWPEEPASFAADVTTWFRAAGDLARTMEEVFALALGLPSGWFTTSTDHSIDVLRLVNYAVPEGTPVLPDQLGMGAHTDYGMVTILWADPVPGLEVLDPAGDWGSVVPLDGALLVNLGDLTARWTNDRWRSTMHRVVPPVDDRGRSVRRRSAAFFHDGNADAVVSTLEPCRDADSGSAYPDTTVGEHLARKLAGSRGLELNDRAEREASRLGPPTR